MKSATSKIILFCLCLINTSISQDLISVIHPEIDSVLRKEYLLNKVNRYIVKKTYYRNSSAPNIYLIKRDIDKLGNMVADSGKSIVGEIKSYSRNYILDRNGNILQIIQNGIKYSVHFYDTKNRIIKDIYYNKDGSILREFGQDYLFDDHLVNLLNHYGNKEIDTIISNYKRYIFINSTPLKILEFSNQRIIAEYEIDNKGRVLIETQYNKDGDTLSYQRVQFNNESKNEIREGLESNVYYKYLYKYDNRNNFIKTYKFITNDSTLLVFSREYDDKNNLRVSRSFEDDSSYYSNFYSYNKENKLTNFMSIKNGKIMFQRSSDYYSNGLIKCVKEYEGSKLIKEENYSYEYY